MSPQEASAISTFLLNQLEGEQKTTSRVLAAVPDEKADYRPDPKSMAARDLARHIAFVEIWFLESVLKGEFTRPDDSAFPSSIPAVVEAYDSGLPPLLDRLRELTPEQLVEPITFFNWTMPRVDFVQIAQKHTIHHRGQLSTYLRPMGARVPSIYGGSADEPMKAEAGS